MNIDNYKEYSEVFSSIEIDIIPTKNKYGKFININEENEEYCHIYLNSNQLIFPKNKTLSLLIIKYIILYHNITKI